MRTTVITPLLALALALSAASRAEDAVPVTVCQLLADPPAYNHKLIRIAGSVSFGLENFTLHEDPCGGDVWLAYGRARKTHGPLVVEGIATTLVEDSTFQQFDAVVRQPLPKPLVHATLVGRYFAGKTSGYPGDKHWGGFGQWDQYTLLVIQQVISFETR
jgi:hypothetical protein